MDRFQEPSAALAELTDSIRPDEPQEVLLARVASRVVTGPALVRSDLVQYATGTGPCLDALRTETLVRAERPEMKETAEEAGIVTLSSCPLFLPADGAVTSRRALDHRLSGALNVWSSRHDAFAPVESTLIAMFTSALSAIILTAARWAAAKKKADDLRTALGTRYVIATAEGIVMVQRRLDVDEAFQWLVDVAQRLNRKVRDLAKVIADDPAVVGDLT